MTLLPIEELLAGCAEEACELAQAALKVRRAYDRTNPTPMPIWEAWQHFHEELADLEIYLEQIAYDRVAVDKFKAEKMERWKKRIG